MALALANVVVFLVPVLVPNKEHPARPAAPKPRAHHRDVAPWENTPANKLGSVLPDGLHLQNRGP